MIYDMKVYYYVINKISQYKCGTFVLRRILNVAVPFFVAAKITRRFKEMFCRETCKIKL